MSRRYLVFWLSAFIAFSSAVLAAPETMQDGWSAYEGGDFPRAYDIFSSLLR